MEKRMVILTCIFSALTLFFSVMCTTITIQSEKNRTEVNSSSILANNHQYYKTSIIYEQNNNLNINNLSPGDSIEKEFSITNSNSDTITYKITWQNVNSIWNNQTIGYNEIHPEEFVYSLACSNGESVVNKAMPLNSNDQIILEKLSLKTNRTNKCKLTISFINMNKDQSYNYNKSFGGEYKVLIYE